MRIIFKTFGIISAVFLIACSQENDLEHKSLNSLEYNGDVRHSDLQIKGSEDCKGIELSNADAEKFLNNPN